MNQTERVERAESLLNRFEQNRTNTDRVLINGTELDDFIATPQLLQDNPGYFGYSFEIRGLGGDDFISLSNLGRTGNDQAWGGVWK